SDKGARLNWVVLEGNTYDDSSMLIQHGTQHLIARNNILKNTGVVGVEINGYSSIYGRGVVDATFVNNTGVNTSTRGNFVRLDGDANGINLVNNLYLAPNLYT